MPIDEGAREQWSKGEPSRHPDNRFPDYFPTDEAWLQMQQEKMIMIKEEVKEFMNSINVEALKAKDNIV